MMENSEQAHHLADARRHADWADQFAAECRYNEAAWRYDQAADCYRRAGQRDLAGMCERLATAERAMIRPTGRPNITALVD